MTFLSLAIMALPFGFPEVVVEAQRQPSITFAFWNVENLFDAEDDPENRGDDEYLPENGWTAKRYGLKLDRLAEIVTALDCHLLGLAEVENRRVLLDLVNRPGLKELGYHIAHRDSPDKRGIDLALECSDLGRVGGIENQQLGKSLERTEARRQHFRAEAGAAHSQQEYVRHILDFDFSGERL